MSSVIPARRRAEEFAALVDGVGNAAGTRHEDLVELVTLLRGTPLVEPRAGFVTGLREALLAEADVALAPVDTKLAMRTHTRTRRDRRFAIAAGTAVLLGTGTSMAVAAQDALPGDALYPVKRIIEGAHSALQVDEVSKARVLLASASGRLDEASALKARGDSGDSALPDALDDFSSQSQSAADLVLDDFERTGDRAPVEDLRAFAAESMDRLVELSDDLPSSARGNLEHAAQVIAQIDDRAATACPDCAGGIDEVPPMFLRSFSDLATPTATEVGPPVVIVPRDRTGERSSQGSTTTDTSGDDEDSPTSLLPTDGGDGAGDTLGDVTDKLLSPDKKKASLPDKPVKDVTDTLQDGVVDPLLGGLLP
ncbi:hypothetical protein EKO23_03775 [Nocardioides guangzhouensis]|uniref:DUF5667 domain-containing protein n=1 Tax=Nocardioides guangzhouensis TaxID=2497878 RepID=A0A4Q4ZKD3_9ACTN|nr:DUF5667 domain-containing protein [Nocardioides guangzhouensis]RYP87981.1 hypothetical protein EKO23_03775 [Nocardioides guangzhouensis]